MSEPAEVVEAVAVHVRNVDELGRAVRPARAAGEPEQVTCTTLILTATDPVQQLAPIDPLRRDCIVMQAGDNDIIICASKGEAQAGSNSTALLPNPSGALMLKTVLAPLSIRTQGRLFVTAQAFPTRVSVIITRRAG